MDFPLSFPSKELAESHLGSKQARLIFRSLCFGGRSVAPLWQIRNGRVMVMYKVLRTVTSTQ